MRVVPRNKVPQIQFYSNHLSHWLEHATEIGVSLDQVALLQEQVDIARAKFKAQQAARQTAEAATEAFHFAVAAMNRTGASLLQQIRAHGSTSGPETYELAQVPSPAKKSPIGPPGTPSGFTVDLHADGSLLLGWKCNNPRGSVGTLYHVHRQITAPDGTTGPFEFLGATGKKQFLDTTIPPGTAMLVYQLQALRSTAAGPIATHPVTFGNASPRSSAPFAPRRAA